MTLNFAAKLKSVSNGPKVSGCQPLGMGQAVAVGEGVAVEVDVEVEVAC